MRNAARLPRFQLPDSSRTIPIQARADFTGLVPTARQKHTYLNRIKAPTGELRAVARWADRSAINRSLDAFVCQVGRQVQGLKLGYLVRINAAIDASGRYAPDYRNILTGIGFGTEPIDALASAMAFPTITSTKAPSDASHYVWFTCEGLGIEATSFEIATTKSFESRAGAEAARRAILGQAIRPDGPNGVARAQVAEYWKDIAARRTRIWENADALRRGQELQTQLEAAQDRFNTAYRNYQSITREMANEAAEMQALNFIESLLSVAGHTANAVGAISAERTAKLDMLRAGQSQRHSDATSARQGLSEAQDLHIAAWHAQGFPAVPPAQIPDVPTLDPAPRIILRTNVEGEDRPQIYRPEHY